MKRFLFLCLLILSCGGSSVDRHDFYYGQLVAEGDLDQVEDNVEDEIGQLAGDVFGKWVLTQREYPYESSPVDMYVHVPVNSAYVVDPDVSSDNVVDARWETDQDVNCAVDKDSVSTIPSAGNKRYISVFAKYVRNEYDTRVDKLGNPVNYRQDDDFAIEVWSGVEDPSPVKLASPGDEYVLLFDVLLEETTTAISDPVDWNNPIVNEIDISRVNFNKNVQVDDLDDLVNTIKLKVATGEVVNAYDVVEYANSVRTVFDDDLDYNIRTDKYAITSYDCFYIHGVALSDNKIFLAFNRISPVGGYCCIVKISNDGDISVGTIYQFSASASLDGTWCDSLDYNKVIITYGLTAPISTRARIAVINGDVISFGTENSFDTYGGYWTEVVSLSSSKALCIYFDGANADGRARILNISGTTITEAVTAYSLGVFQRYIPFRDRLAKLSQDKVLYTYPYTNRYVHAKVLDISGDTITVGADQTIDNTIQDYCMSTTALSSGRVLIASGYDLRLRFRLLGITGTTVSILDTYDITDYEDVTQVGVSRVSGNKVSFAFFKNDNLTSYVEYFGMLNIKDDNINISGLGIISTYSSVEYINLVVTENDIYHFTSEDLVYGRVFEYSKIDGNKIIGIATETKSGDEILKIKKGGVVNGLSGLIPGDVYYCGADGVLKNNNYAVDVPRVTSPLLLPESMRMGIAISDTQLLIQR